MASFAPGDRVYWASDSCHTKGTVVESGLPYEFGGTAGHTRPCGVKVQIDEDDRRSSCGEQRPNEFVIFPDWSARLRHLPSKSRTGVNALVP